MSSLILASSSGLIFNDLAKSLSDGDVCCHSSFLFSWIVVEVNLYGLIDWCVANRLVNSVGRRSIMVIMWVKGVMSLILA